MNMRKMKKVNIKALLHPVEVMRWGKRQVQINNISANELLQPCRKIQIIIALNVFLKTVVRFSIQDIS